MAHKFPAWADRQAQQIADAVARRLLAERLDADSLIDRAPWAHGDRLDGGEDQTTPLQKGGVLPD